MNFNLFWKVIEYLVGATYRVNSKDLYGVFYCQQNECTKLFMGKHLCNKGKV